MKRPDQQCRQFERPQGGGLAGRLFSVRVAKVGTLGGLESTRRKLIQR
jgi:hypothetical protein